MLASERVRDFILDIDKEAAHLGLAFVCGDGERREFRLTREQIRDLRDRLTKCLEYIGEPSEEVKE